MDGVVEPVVGDVVVVGGGGVETVGVVDDETVQGNPRLKCCENRSND